MVLSINSDRFCQNLTRAAGTRTGELCRFAYCQKRGVDGIIAHMEVYLAVRKLKGVLVWFAQAGLTLLAFVALTLLIWMPGPWYDIMAWAGMPILGLFSAYLATRHGVNNYIAWSVPPAAVFFAHYIVTGYTPNGPGPTMVAALLAIIGAAAGHVRNRGGR